MFRYMSFLFTVAVLSCVRCTTVEANTRNLEGKVVIANVDKYDVTFRVGKLNKSVSPKKASILSPKKFPITLQVWSGNQQLQWQQLSVSKAGLYVARYTAGRWTLTKREPRPKTATASSRANASATTNSTVANPRVISGSRTGVQHGFQNRIVGSRPRIVQRGGGTRVVANPPRLGRRWRGNYWSPVARGIWAAGTIYQFLRDEEDRDLFRRLIVDREIDDIVRREIEDRLWDRIKDDAINLPITERDALRGVWDEIRDIDDAEWKEAVNLPANEWEQIRNELKDEFSDAEWQGIESEIGEIGRSLDLTESEIETLDEVGLEDLEQEVDLTDLQGTEVGDVGQLDLGDVAGDFDLGDFTMEVENLDLGDLSDIGGADWDLGSTFSEVGGLGGQIIGNIGGNIDGGGWDSYDYGDYDWGGGNDFGGGAIGGSDWGGDLGGGGDWGGDWGDGGDWGGGDFGGGFDDFGGDFDW